MTRREIFLQADPREVNDAYCRRFTYPYRIEGAFNICKGLKFFARGERYDEPWEAAIERINSGEGPKFTPKQAHIILTSFRGCLEAALDALGFNQAPNQDELVNEWLDQTIPDGRENANLLALDIISNLIIK